MLLPFVHELAKSLSYPSRVNDGSVTFVPQQPTWGNYLHFTDPTYVFLWRSFLNTTFLTVVGTLWSVFFTALMAYPMSRPRTEFRIGPGLMILVVFTIIFFPPVIPYFLAVRAYGLMDSLWAIIFAHTVMPFHLILVVSYYRGIPEAMFDSCRIDGANDLRIVWQVAMPLSKPVLATIAVYTAVILWNILFHALLFIRNPKLMPLQPMVRAILQESTQFIGDARMQRIDPFYRSESSYSALVLMTTIPIIVVYPFLQKYFIKGALLGALKS
jgi:putative aldouronate transport system permease protein